MRDLLVACVFHLSLVLTGLIVLERVGTSLSRWEKFALCFPCGAALQTVFLCAWCWIFPLSSGLAWLLCLVPICVAILGAIRRGFSWPETHFRRALPWGMGGLVFAALYYRALTTGMLEWDAWAHWYFKSQLYFHQRTYFVPELWRLVYLGPHYPPLLSLMGAQLYFLLGHVNDSLAVGVAFLYLPSLYLGLAGIAGRLGLNRWLSMGLPWLLIGSSIHLWLAAGSGLGDVPIASSLVLVAMVALREEMDPKGILLGLAVLMIALVKDEGLAYGAVAMAVVFCFTRPRALRAGLIFVAGYFPWWCFARAIPTHYKVGFRPEVLRPEFLGDFFGAYTKALFTGGLFWIFLAALTATIYALVWGTRRHAMPGLILLGCVGAQSAAYVFSELGFAHFQLTIFRVQAQLLPLSFFALLLWAGAARREFIPRP